MDASPSKASQDLIHHPTYYVHSAKICGQKEKPSDIIPRLDLEKKTKSLIIFEISAMQLFGPVPIIPFIA